MEKVKEYLYLCISLIAVTGIVRLAAPEGSVKKYIHYICTLCVCASLSIPLIKVFSDFPDITKSIGSYEQNSTISAGQSGEEAAILLAKQNIEDSVCEYLCAEYGFSAENTEVQVTIDDQNPSEMKIVSVFVSIPDKDYEKRVETWLKSVFIGETEISVTSQKRGK